MTLWLIYSTIQIFTFIKQMQPITNNFNTLTLKDRALCFASLPTYKNGPIYILQIYAAQ